MTCPEASANVYLHNCQRVCPNCAVLKNVPTGHRLKFSTSVNECVQVLHKIHPQVLEQVSLRSIKGNEDFPCWANSLRRQSHLGGTRGMKTHLLWPSLLIPRTSTLHANTHIHTHTRRHAFFAHSAHQSKDKKWWVSSDATLKSRLQGDYVSCIEIFRQQLGRVAFSPLPQDLHALLWDT